SRTRSETEPAGMMMASACEGSGSATTRKRPALRTASTASAARTTTAARTSRLRRMGRGGYGPAPRRARQGRLERALTDAASARSAPPMQSVQTVTGGCAPDALGLTLMHEHLLIGWPGWEAEAPLDRATRREHTLRCVDRLAELYDIGVRTMVDPCPIDLGRDVEFMAEVAQRSRVRIVCATGLYKEDTGAPAYFKFRQQFGDALSEMTDVFVREITEGIGESGVRAGVIKVATGVGRITPYEELVLRAAARAHRATGVPVTTHTDEGTMGPEQLEILVAEGVAPAAVVVGHSCG